MGVCECVWMDVSRLCVCLRRYLCVHVPACMVTQLDTTRSSELAKRDCSTWQDGWENWINNVRCSVDQHPRFLSSNTKQRTAQRQLRASHNTHERKNSVLFITSDVHPVTLQATGRFGQHTCLLRCWSTAAPHAFHTCQYPPIPKELTRRLVFFFLLQLCQAFFLPI